MDKSPDAFRTISEVADDLDLPQHVLRFWETRFSQIRPMKRGGGRRYYRPDDVELLKGIRHLLYGQGFTIKGVQRILREQGIRFVIEIGRNPGLPIPAERPSPVRGAASREAEEESALDVLDEEVLVGDPSGIDMDDEPDGAGPEAAEPDREETALPAGILPDEPPVRGGLRFMERFRGHETASSGTLSRDDIRRLQATLFELLECKRLLDQTR